MANPHPSYGRVFLTFARNSMVRDMQFRTNFWIECVSSTSWVLMNIGFYMLVFRYADELGAGTGWGKFEFFVFLSTTMFVNSIVQAFFMLNAEEFSELIRTGGLDFALLKPIDTQFLVSLQKVSWSSLSNFFVGLVLLAVSLYQLATRAENPWVPRLHHLLLYPFYVICGVLMLYSLMIALSATSIWLGRNQSLYDFWFYITNFSRYPMEIYRGPIGTPLRQIFTWIIPVLVVVNVPARVLVRPLRLDQPGDWVLPLFAILATVLSLAASRWVFQRALGSYRSASS